MAEINYKTISGILLAILVISNGAQYMLNATGKSSACTKGWEFQSTGDHEGQYKCATTTPRYFYCASIRDSANTKNYWCDIAELVAIKTEEKTSQPIGENIGKPEICSNKPYGCVAR